MTARLVWTVACTACGWAYPPKWYQGQGIVAAKTDCDEQARAHRHLCPGGSPAPAVPAPGASS